MKFKFTYSVLFAILVYCITLSNSGGKMGSAASGCGVSGCHGTKNTNTTISANFNGITRTNYTPGTKYTVLIDVSNSNFLNATDSAGFDLEFSAGSISNAPPKTMIMGKELHHTARKALVDGATPWTFDWTAPAAGAGTVTLNISGNATNSNNTTSGDQWNTLTISLSEIILPKDTAKVSITASATTILAGANVTFTAAQAKGGTLPVYQWKLNGTNVGTNSTTFSSNTLVNGDKITCVMTSNLAGVIGSPATSNEITMIVTQNNSINSKLNSEISLFSLDRKLSIISNQSKLHQLEIYSLTGRKVFNTQVLPNQNIDLSGLISGMYIVQVKVGSQTITKKIQL